MRVFNASSVAFTQAFRSSLRRCLFDSIELARLNLVILSSRLARSCSAFSILRRNFNSSNGVLTLVSPVRKDCLSLVWGKRGTVLAKEARKDPRRTKVPAADGSLRCDGPQKHFRSSWAHLPAWWNSVAFPRNFPTPAHNSPLPSDSLRPGGNVACRSEPAGPSRHGSPPGSCFRSATSMCLEPRTSKSAITLPSGMLFLRERCVWRRRHRRRCRYRSLPYRQGIEDP